MVKRKRAQIVLRHVRSLSVQSSKLCRVCRADKKCFECPGPGTEREVCQLSGANDDGDTWSVNKID